MRDLTTHDLNAELAEQLPARELMGRCWHPSSPSSTTYNTTIVSQSGNGSNDGNGSLIGGNLDGNFSGDNVYVF